VNSPRTALAALVPPTKTGRTFATVALVDSAGTGCYLEGSTLYFLRTVGLSAGQVALGLAVANIVALLSAVPMGTLISRYDAKRVLLLLQGWRAVWFVALAFADGPVSFTIVSAMLMIAERSVSPVTQAVVTAAIGEADRVTTLAAMRSVRNIGFSCGAAMTAPLLALHSALAYRSIILLDAVSFLGAAMLLARLRLEANPHATPKHSPLEFIARFRNWGSLALAAVDGVLTLHVTLLSIALPVWIADYTRVPVAWLSAFMLINMIGAVLLQVPLSRAVERPGGELVVLRRAGWALALCAVLLMLSYHRPAPLGGALLGGAVLCLTAGELWQAVASWEISYRLAPKERKIEYLSVYGLGFATQEIAGPALVLGLLSVRRGYGLLALAALFIVTTLLARPLLRLADRQHRPENCARIEAQATA